MSIDSTIKQLENMLSYFEKYRKEGFTKSIDLAKSVVLEMNVEPIFPTKRRVIKKNILERIMRNMKTSHQKNHLELAIFLLLLIWQLLL